jgi:hypothetical protein
MASDALLTVAAEDEAVVALDEAVVVLEAAGALEVAAVELLTAAEDDVAWEPQPVKANAARAPKTRTDVFFMFPYPP